LGKEAYQLMRTSKPTARAKRKQTWMNRYGAPCMLRRSRATSTIMQHTREAFNAITVGFCKPQNCIGVALTYL